MPELPEVQNVINSIQQCIGETIYSFSVSDKQLRQKINLNKEIINTKIKSISRKAKYIIIDLDNDISIVIHLGMSGIITLTPKKDYVSQKHDHVILNLKNNALVLNDPRRFGLCIQEKTKNMNNLSIFKDIGEDALSNKLTGEDFYNKLQKYKTSIKQSLLNQKIISGCGNIYASEALYKSSINPLKPSKELTLEQASVLLENLKNILIKSIKNGGSTLKDYRKPDGSIGGYQDNFLVYGKDGVSCDKCTENKKNCSIKKINISGRSTFYCENTQI